MKLLKVSHRVCVTVPGISCFNSLTASHEVLSGAPLGLWLLQAGRSGSHESWPSHPSPTDMQICCFQITRENPRDEDKTPIVCSDKTHG